MINELSRLAESIKDANIETETWHPKLLIIPKITPNAPCVRILLKEGRVSRLCRVSSEIREIIRKYGDNQGTFPAMNLASLFRITDENVAKKISAWIKANGVGVNLEEVRSWCTENNWSEKFAKKYRVSICDRPSDLKVKTAGVFKTDDGFEPLNVLINALKPIQDPIELHRQLYEVALDMIEKGIDVQLALQTLFYFPKKSGDYGNLSVVFDCLELEERRFSTIDSNFTRGLNAALLCENSDTEDELGNNRVDAFGLPYRDVEDTMPKVALPVGFDVTLRTMYHGQPCQQRYGKIESGSYPLSSEKRKEIKTSLEWLARESNRNKTWVKTGKSEAFFAYPSKIPASQDDLNVIQIFADGSKDSAEDAEDREVDFLAAAENFLEFISKTKKIDIDNLPEHIQLFALNKYDKARTRISYSRCVTPESVIKQSGVWREAADNLPPLWILRSPKILFPLSVAPVMNRIWNRDGTQASKEYRHTGRYHGVDLFFGVLASVLQSDLSELVHNTENMAVYASKALRSKDRDAIVFSKCLKETLALMGMYLYWLGIGKEGYMNEYPFLFGQLLKISDAVHELYCVKVRERTPTQLLGSAMYSGAAEKPLQSLALLSVRIQPYLSWCKANRGENIGWKDKNGEFHDGLTAAYYLHQYEVIADKLKNAFAPQTRFSDVEKAQLFIGYLASFEKKTNDSSDNTEETEGENDNE